MKRPFWMHQLVEYVLAVCLIFAGAHSPNPAVPCVSGALIALNAAAVDGPWSAFHGVPRWLHRFFDWAIAIGMLVAAIFFGRLFDSSSRSVTLLMAFVVAFVAWRSDYTKKAKKTPVSMDGGRHVEVSRLAGRGAANTVNLARALKRARQISKDSDESKA